MSYIPQVMEGFARLLSYPDPRTTGVAELMYVILQSEVPDAAAELSEFGRYLDQHELCEAEEAFTSTFDVNPALRLEVGWHLFGEEYARGMFLVRMRQELRRYGLSESTELPDHLSHVLAVVAAMPDEEASRFVRACVQPAVEKMHGALAKLDTPYRFAIAGLATVIRRRWGTRGSDAEPGILASGAPALDPLHAFPVADVGCPHGCGGPRAEPSLVQLDARIPLPREAGGRPDFAAEEVRS